MKQLASVLGLILAGTLAFAQNTEVVVPNENLVVQGVPAVPASIAERANQYTESRAAAALDWHPLKREMLITTRFAEVNQIHEIKMPGGARMQLTFFPDRTGGAAYHPHKGDYFVFSKDVGGGEWFQLYRYDVASGNVTLLTDGKSRNIMGPWANAGDRVAYGSTRRSRGDLDFYIIDPSNKSSDRLLVQNQGGGWGISDWSPDDKTLLAEEYVSVNESYLWLVDVATGNKTLLTPKGGEKISYDAIGFSRDGKGIYVTTDQGSEFQRIAYIDLATKKPTFLTDYKWEVEGGRLSWDRKLIAFTTNENGLGVLHVLDTAAGKERALPKLPVGIIGGINWHENNRDLAFSITSARSPSDVYSLDITAGKVDRWTYSETGGLNPLTFSEPELVKWKSFDGLEISGFLYMPDAAKFAGKRPVIINIHGGPEGQSRPGFLGRSNYFINETGVAIIFPNVRGSLGYGKTFALADNGMAREGTYKDIEALLDWIKTRPDLDANRVMVTGGSYGGHMTLAIATRYNDRIACSLDVVGISNFVTFLQNTEAYRRDLRRAEYGDERDPKMREYFERTAPFNMAKNITKPLFVVQGKNDPRVPISEADQMVSTVRQNGTPVWYLVGKDEGHGFGKKKNADFQFYSTILFMQQFLAGEPAAKQASLNN
ncbi:MAG TPA: S9 family peptidase [Clostridia bacterium]|nr:S9 family peptidase [Clostridia bacterium]